MTKPLASWHDTPARAAIVDFVERTTSDGSPDFVDPIDRVAVFDNDGTLWTEQPTYNQLLFALDRLRELAPGFPEWHDQPALRAALDGDLPAFAATGMAGVVDLLAATHAGMTTDEFRRIVRDWIETAVHPRWNLPYPRTAYRPMIELLDYVRTHGYRTYIVSGGGVEFMRAFAADAYGIPPEQIIGSTGKTAFDMVEGAAVLKKLPEIDVIDDGPGKPVAIDTFIGRRPVIAVGNTDGDMQMLQYTEAGEGPRFMALLRHDDDEREVAYDRSLVGKLDEALAYARDHDWLVISMKNDFRTVFGD